MRSRPASTVRWRSMDVYGRRFTLKLIRLTFRLVRLYIEYNAAAHGNVDEGRRMRKSVASRKTRYTAVVHAADGIRFVASAPTGAALASQLVSYICERCDDTLWPPVARDVRALIDADQPFAAIAKYFGSVGARWDAERLELRGPDFSAA